MPQPVPDPSTEDVVSSCPPLGASPPEPRLGPPVHTAPSVLFILRSLLDAGDQGVRPDQLATDASREGLVCTYQRAANLRSGPRSRPPHPRTALSVSSP